MATERLRYHTAVNETLVEDF